MLQNACTISWKLLVYLSQKSKAQIRGNVTANLPALEVLANVAGSMRMYTPDLLHADLLGNDKNKLNVKYEYFCNQYGGP